MLDEDQRAPDVGPESPATVGDQSQDLGFVREAAAQQNQPGDDVILSPKPRDWRAGLWSRSSCSAAEHDRFRLCWTSLAVPGAGKLSPVLHGSFL